MSAFRPTLRLRLTVLYAGLLVGVGVVLLLTSYLLLRQALAQGPQFEPGSIIRVDYGDGRFGFADAREIQLLLQHQTEQAMLRRGLLMLAVVSATAIAGGYLLAGRALRPLHAVTATARRLSTETLDQRIGLAGPDDELKELADTFDGMIARLQAAFEGQRRFVANASHELRTPLSVMRTEVDVALRDPDASVAELRRMAGVVRDATDRADQLVEALLLLARTDVQARQGPAVREPVDLPAAVAAALAAVRAEAESAGLLVERRLDPASVVGDPRLLERLAGNLVENAVRHNVDHGWLAVRTWTADGRAWLAVSNSGPPIDSADVPGLFEPFRRGGMARTATRGAGLGLSIVRAVVLVHGGAVSARALPDGGLEVVAQLPAS